MQNFSVSNFFEAFLIITVFIGIAYAIRKVFFKNLILPASLLAGVLAYKILTKNTS